MTNDIDISNTDDTVELYGDKEARWYQIAAVNSVASALEGNPFARMLVVSPTGTGKTITSGLVFSSNRIRKALNVKSTSKLNLIYIAHKHRLLSQAEQAYADANMVNFIPQSAFSPIDDEVIKSADIICIDEAHHEAMMTIQYQLDKIGNKPILGLTATPDRGDGCVIKFEVIIEWITRAEAVAQGFLAPTHIHSFVDPSGRDKSKIICDIIRQYGDNLFKSMVFLSTKAEVELVGAYARHCGIHAVPILSQTERQLNTLLDQFSDQKVDMLINCNKISEGVDVKGCVNVVLGKQYGTYAALNQVIGRASRPDSECHVWELVNPLSARNLDTTAIVGTPESHELISLERGQWVSRQFDYTSAMNRNAPVTHSTARLNAFPM